MDATFGSAFPQPLSSSAARNTHTNKAFLNLISVYPFPFLYMLYFHLIFPFQK